MKTTLLEEDKRMHTRYIIGQNFEEPRGQGKIMEKLRKTRAGEN